VTTSSDYARAKEERMRPRGASARSRWVLLVGVVAVVVGIASAPRAASAAPSMTASGTFTTASVVTFDLVRSADGNEFFDVTGTTAWTGTFSGTSTEKGTVVFYSNGSDAFRAVSTFTGTVNGVSGTVTFELTGRNGPDLSLRATAAITNATGGLTGLHGVVTWQGTVGPDGPLGTYSGQIGYAST
jgi:Protein of unknown function (DUF3224)